MSNAWKFVAITPIRKWIRNILTKRDSVNSVGNLFQNISTLMPHRGFRYCTFFVIRNKCICLPFSRKNHVCSNCRKIVLVAIQDQGSTYISPAIDALKRVGATDDLLNLTEFRGSFALVGFAGVNRPSWIAQQNAKRERGPSEISLTIPSSEGISSFYWYPIAEFQLLNRWTSPS